MFCSTASSLALSALYIATQSLCSVAPAAQQEGCDQPVGAQVEAALIAGYAVLTPVAIDRRATVQFSLDRDDGRFEPWVMRADESRYPDVQRGDVKVVPVVGGSQRTDPGRGLRVPAPRAALSRDRL